jgi:hypothetical protein
MDNSHQNLGSENHNMYLSIDPTGAYCHGFNNSSFIGAGGKL